MTIKFSDIENLNISFPNIEHLLTEEKTENSNLNSILVKNIDIDIDIDVDIEIKEKFKELVYKIKKPDFYFSRRYNSSNNFDQWIAFGYQLIVYENYSILKKLKDGVFLFTVTENNGKIILNNIDKKSFLETNIEMVI